MKYKDKNFNENTIRLVDSDFLEMFSFSLIRGDSKTAFSDLNSILITEEIAMKYFGTEDPMGKILKVNNKLDLKVTGILAPVPSVSSLQFECLAPFEILREQENLDYWGAWRYRTYVMLKENSSLELTNEKIAGIIQKHDKKKDAKPILQLYGDIYLKSDFLYDGQGVGDNRLVWLFIGLAVFVLVIACINFINLTTARAGTRAKEVGMRKVVGAQKKNLVKQFFSETILLTIFSLFLALLLVKIFLPWFNRISGREIVIDLVNNPMLLFGFIGIACVTGIISGIYPAIILSAFQPVKVLKGTVINSRGKASFRKSLVVFQFALTIILIIGTVIVRQLVSYMLNTKLRFHKEHIIKLPVRGNIRDSFQTFKNRLLENSDILCVSSSFQLPTGIGSSPGEMDWEGKDPQSTIIINAGLVGYDYFKTFDIQFAEGRPFLKEYATDATEAYIVNETAVKAMGMESGIGKRFMFWDTPGKIIGVVKDFHCQPLQKKINPIVLRYDDYWMNHIYVRVQAGHYTEAIKAIKNVWMEINPNHPFDYKFLDEIIDLHYRTEQRVGETIHYFTIIALTIASLGLLGLASFIAEQRKKEISVRKVLGASISEVVILLSKEFVKWVLISNIIAWPVAYFFMNKLLQSYAYRINVGLEILFISSFLAPAWYIFTEPDIRSCYFQNLPIFHLFDFLCQFHYWSWARYSAGIHFKIKVIKAIFSKFHSLF